jgi:hypothetical protein
MSIEAQPNGHEFPRIRGVSRLMGKPIVVAICLTQLVQTGGRVAGIESPVGILPVGGAGQLPMQIAAKVVAFDGFGHGTGNQVMVAGLEAVGLGAFFWFMDHGVAVLGHLALHMFVEEDLEIAQGFPCDRFGIAAALNVDGGGESHAALSAGGDRAVNQIAELIRSQNRL